MSDSGVTVVVVTYNSRDMISRCLESVHQQDTDVDNVVVVDNASTDDTVELVKRDFPNVRVINNESNLGYGAANNIGVSKSDGDVVVFANPDVTLARNWCGEVTTALKGIPSCGAVEGKLLLAKRPGVLNCRGSYVNLLGFGCSRGYGEPDNLQGGLTLVSFPSGAAFGIRRDAFEDVGGFDERYFLYHEDVDLGLQLWTHGWKVANTPRAVAYHQHDDAMRPAKLYYLERNRWLSLFKHMPRGYFVRCGPLIVFGELAVFWYSASRGLLRAKGAATLDVLRTLPDEWNFRRRLDSVRPGKAVAASLLTPDFPTSLQIGARVRKLSGRLMSSYGRAFFPNPAFRTEERQFR